MIKTGERSHGPNGLLFEAVEIPPGTLITPDGREVLWVDNQSYALRPEIHARRLSEGITEAKQRIITTPTQKKKPEQAPGEAITSVLCPVCYSIMAKFPVCPRCDKGRDGFKILCICTACNHEVYL